MLVDFTLGQCFSLGVLAMSGLSEKQKALRLPCLPASELAGLMGWNSYCSPQEELDRHMGRAEFKGNSLTEAGHDMEDGIARMTAKRLKWGEMERNPTLVHPDGWASATPDRLFLHRPAGLQIKNHGGHMVKTYAAKPGVNGSWDNNVVPKMYLIQCLWEMEVTRAVHNLDIQEWVLGAYFGGDNLRLYHIKRDPLLIRDLWRAGHAFWRKHIDPAGPMTPVIDQKWHAAPKAEARRPRKLTNDELAAAPIPFFETLI